MKEAVAQRFRRKRVAVVRWCAYAMTEWRDSNTLLFLEGDAYSINVSAGGMLLLMSHTPDIQQVFEVYTPIPGEAAMALAVVAVRWTRQVVVDAPEGLSMVGVEFLLNPIASQGASRALV